jgi:hypothetical protein
MSVIYFMFLNSNEKQDGVAAECETETDFKIIESETSRFELNNTLGCWHLDGRLWISCRLALVKCLLYELKGFGRLSNS